MFKCIDDIYFFMLPEENGLLDALNEIIHQVGVSVNPKKTFSDKNENLNEINKLCVDMFLRDCKLKQEWQAVLGKFCISHCVWGFLCVLGQNAGNITQ